MMPQLDGYQVLKTIREIEKDKGIEPKQQVKVIMMTALSAEKNVKMAFELGATVYCAKPVDVDKLKMAMKKLTCILLVLCLTLALCLFAMPVLR